MTLDIELLSGLLDAAARAGVTLSPFAERHQLDLSAGYEVQRAVVARRLARGERVVGLKMGYISAVMSGEMDRPNCGWLTGAMELPDGVLDRSRFIHPRVEPEVAIRLGRDLPGPVERQALAAAVDAVAPALEVVDSRLHAYQYSVPDNTADNSSAAGFVVGAWRPWPQEVGGLTVRLAVNGSHFDTASSDVILGHPLRSLEAASQLAAELGRPLRAGMIVLTGGITASHAIAAGDRVEASFEGLGEVRLDAL
jgi:2-oxo-3-hexenedioate decarboxylase